MVTSASLTGGVMRTLGDLKWLLTAGKPSAALKAATLLGTEVSRD
jgi:hypothetical protein